ncbi:MAG: LicD family protein [Mogibacterium sp.]|nr:LicD family protein [Mogibacterium sp.]
MSTKLQGILVQLLREIDEICRKNDIRYYLWGGTCIGQLRHGGFIPWDDDIDIVMPRKDYEKFEAIIDECMPEGRDLVSVGRYSTYTNPIPRYMDLTTTALRRGRLGDGTVCGECIEIFILDPMPRDKAAQDEWKKLLYVYCEVLCTGWVQAKRRLRKDFIDIGLYRKYRKEQSSKGREAVLAELEGMLFNIDEEDSDTYCLRWMPRGLYEIPIRCYGTPKDVIYEGMHVLGPERPAEMLQLYIGYSWRNLLPPDAREPHKTKINHGLAAGNCEREFWQVMSNAEMADILQKCKDLSMDYYEIRHNHFVDRTRPSVKYVQTKTAKLAGECGIERMRSDNKLALKVLDEYIRMQRSALFRYNDIVIPMDDELVDIAVRALFEEARVPHAFDILHTRNKGGAVLTELQQHYYRAAKDFLKMSVHLDEGEYEEAESIAKAYDEVFPGHRWLQRCRVRIAHDLAKSQEDWANLRDLAAAGLEAYPDDDMLQKRYADALWETGEHDKADEIYHKVARKSINGLLLREMKEHGIEEAALKLDAKVWEFDN